jgi:hypothetical protein
VSVATIVRRTGSGVRDVQPPPLLAVARGSAVRLLAVSPLRAEVSLQEIRPQGSAMTVTWVSRRLKPPSPPRHERRPRRSGHDPE